MTLSPTALEEAAKAMQAKRAELQHAPLARIYSDLATAAITAYLAQVEKEGLVMVPKEPTMTMVSAPAIKVAEYIRKMRRAGGEVDATDYALRVIIYRAMLAAQNGGE